MTAVQIILIAVGALLADADECSCRCSTQDVCEGQNTLRMDQVDNTAEVKKLNRLYDFVRSFEKYWQNQVAHVVREQLEVGMNEFVEGLKNASQLSKLKEDLIARMESLENLTRALHERSDELDLTMGMLSNKMREIRTAFHRIQSGPKCSVDFNNAGGNTSSVLVWPWTAAVYRKETFGTEHICDGSVIHRHFVLTSAYCMDYYGSAGLSVKLGLGDLKNGAYLQECRVQSTHMHPQFKTEDFDNNFHYDIALLELEEPITFGPFVRPACLPPPEISQDDIFYKSQSTSKAVGLYDYLSSPQTASPTVFNLIILPQEECRRKIIERGWEIYFPLPDLSFCTESSSTTCPYYGSPLMQSRLEEDGTRTWTQVGTRGRSDCKYIFSPRLDHLRTWVDATIAASSKV